MAKNMRGYKAQYIRFAQQHVEFPIRVLMLCVLNGPVEHQHVMFW